MLRILVIALLFCSTDVMAQYKKKEKETGFTEDRFEENYQKRIKKERIHGVYIPMDITDAFMELNRLIAPADRAKFKSIPEEIAVSKLHLSLGRWMIYNWGFYEGSRLSHHLKETVGVSHPDNMAKFIIYTYHRSLNKQPLNVKELVEFFDTKRKKMVEEKKEKSKVIHKETRIKQRQ